MRKSWYVKLANEKKSCDIKLANERKSQDGLCNITQTNGRMSLNTSRDLGKMISYFDVSQ